MRDRVPDFKWLLAGFALVGGCQGDDSANVTETSDGSTTEASASSSATFGSTTGSTESTGDPGTTATSGPSTSDPTTSTSDPSTSDSSTSDPTDTDTDTDTGSTTGGQGGETIECGGDELAPPDEGICGVTKEGSGGVLLRGTVLAPEDVYLKGQVLVVDGVIACVGCDCDGLPEAATATVVECPNGVISPGLINAHDHITFVNNKPIGEGVDRYEHRHDWRIGKNGHKKLSVAGGANKAQVVAGELRFLMGGATSTISAGGQAGLLRNLDSASLLEGLPIKAADSDTFPLDDANGKQLDQGCTYGADATKPADIAKLDAYVPHVSEGIDKSARNEFLCTSMGDGDLLTPITGVVHGIALDAGDASTIRADIAKIVWSPRSNIVLYGNTAPVTILDRLGVPLALGTDWVASGSMNLNRELRCADELNSVYFDHYFSDVELWRMVTTNGALVAGAERAIGMIKRGYIADLAIFDASERPTYRAVIEADPEDVVMVMRGGEVLYGEATLLDSPALGAASCEAMDVCGAPKRVCVEAEVPGVSLAQATAAIAGVYPLFFCGVPDDEPTCVPTRPEYAGITNDDVDGDGVKDGLDNCPMVFNPVRYFEPMQGDFDGDSLGDACDPCPLLAGDSCGAISANDLDGDGIPNGVDNCPKQANAGQEDQDDDGHGDLCDPCLQPNPGPETCSLSIAAIRDPKHPNHPPVGTQVKISGVYVTAVRPNTGGSRGFHVQDETLDPFSGILVFTGSASTTVKVGNRVTVSGVYEEFFGLSEIVSPKVTIEDAGTVLPFAPIMVSDPASIATGGALAEPRESMLVQVADVAITKVNADGNDYDEFEVTGALRIDDTISDNVVNQGLDNKCPIGSKFEKIVGVVGYSFNNSKLWPRSIDDVLWIDCDPFSN